MKTIDEVIELSKRCTLPYPGDCLNCEYFEDETGYDCRCKIIADALYYLEEYQDTIKKLENYQKENQRLKKRVEKLESDAAWDADYRRGQVQGMW